MLFTVQEEQRFRALGPDPFFHVLREEAGKDSEVVKKILSLSRVPFLLFNGNVPREKEQKLEQFDVALMNVVLFHPTSYLEEDILVEELKGDMEREDVLLFLRAYKHVFTELYHLEKEGYFFPHLKLTANVCPVAPITYRTKTGKKEVIQNNAPERVLRSVKQLSVVIPSLMSP